MNRVGEKLKQLPLNPKELLILEWLLAFLHFFNNVRSTGAFLMSLVQTAPLPLPKLTVDIEYLTQRFFAIV